MKKFTFLLAVFIISLNSYAQVIVSVTSVPCNTSLEGLYPYTYAGELDGSSTDWSCPNMYLSANAVSGILEMINDSTLGMTVGIGTPPLFNVPKSALGCDTLGNISQDLTGKIAVIYRGTCQFGLKALNAQMRGAIGVIIINHTGDPAPMAGGAFGVRVTIPVVMIGRVAGDDLFLAIQSCAPNSVTAYIGTKVGLYQNDMGTSMGEVLMPENLTTPITIANWTIFPVDFGLWAYNLGSNIQNGVTATVDVVRNGITVYTQTSIPLNFLPPDFSNPLSVVVDTQFIDLGTYSPSVWAIGIYSVTYIINNLNDEFPTDNTLSFEFKISDENGTGGFSKSRTDNVNNPVYNKMYSYADINGNEDWEVCINFKSSNNAINIENVLFVLSELDSSLTEIIELRAYQWNDVFTDLSTPPSFNNLVLLNSEQLIISNFSQAGQITGSPFGGFGNIPNQRYLFCLYSNSTNLRIGFDEGINYKATANHYQEPISPVRTKTTSGLDYWDFMGIGYGSIPSIKLNLQHLDVEPCNFPPFPCVGIEEKVTEKPTIPYPNPATNLLTVPIRKKVEGKIFVEVFDLAGKLVLSENKIISNEQLKLNVSSISNGAYLFKLTFSDGTHDQFKVSVNR